MYLVVEVDKPKKNKDMSETIPFKFQETQATKTWTNGPEERIGKVTNARRIKACVMRAGIARLFSTTNYRTLRGQVRGSEGVI